MRLWSVWTALFVVATLAISAAAAALLDADRTPSGNSLKPTAQKGDAPSVAPRSVGSSMAMPELAGELDLSTAFGRFWCETGSVSGALHSLRLYGRDVRVPADAKTFPGAPLVEVLLTHEKSSAFFGGEPVLIKTRHGLRCRSASRASGAHNTEREAHRDQLLAVLGEVGIPLDAAVETDRGRSPLRGLLDDSVANFTLDQEEIEWTALAYALYLPPGRQWANKFGVEFTFDQLANELMHRDLGGRRACGGTHLLYSLAVLSRVDQSAPVLSQAVRRELHGYLAAMSDRAAASQRLNGSWGSDWHAGSGPALPATGPPSWGDVLLTGHQLEWLMILPEDSLPPRRCFEGAAVFLNERLLLDERRQMKEHYCPYSHAVRVLSVLAGRPARPGPPPTYQAEASRRTPDLSMLLDGAAAARRGRAARPTLIK